MALSVGIGLTNDCNLHCEHCYRPTDGIYALTLEDVTLVCDHLPIRSMGLGTGENGLHPQFAEIVSMVRQRGILLSMASNGYSVNILSDEQLGCFHDIELSVDFATAREQDAFRGPGNWREVHRAVERCHDVGVTVSLLATMMNVNYQQMGQLAALARSLGANLRVNVYQPVQNARFGLSYEQFWEGFRHLLGASRLVSCTEPVVSAVLGLGMPTTCAHESLRITPQRQVAPCVYWPSTSLTLEDLRQRGEGIMDTPAFQQARATPPAAAACPCQGGCAGRRVLLGRLDSHDLYCPWVRGETIHLEYDLAPEQDLVRKRNYCTTIVM